MRAATTSPRSFVAQQLFPMAKYEVSMPPGFPAGLRVFVVDDDRVVLRTLELMLIKCGYKVTVSDQSLKALELLRANKTEYDIVITDINMPDMDGFKLLEIVGLELDLPVIMLSADCDVNSVMKGIMHGAVDYLVKPARLEELMLIWKHVAKRSLSRTSCSNDGGKKLLQDSGCGRKSKDRRSEREKEDDSESDEDSIAQKRARVTWTKELHAKFIDAVKYLGIDRAVPKKILDLMAVPGLSRENVASHLQKYRKGLKKNAMGISEQLLDTVGRSEQSSRSSFSISINKQYPTICNYSRSNSVPYRSRTMSPSCFPAQPAFSGQARWFPPPTMMINSSGARLGTQHFAKNSGVMRTMNQLTGHQQSLPQSMALSETPSIHQLGFDAQYSCSNDEYAAPSSVQPLDLQAADISLGNILVDNNYLSEIEAILAFDQEQQQQLSSCSGIEVEMGEQVHRGSIHFHSVNLEEQRGSHSSNLTKRPDELNVEIGQFQK